MESIIKFNPAVCVVGNAYQIMVITQKEALISICVKDKIYYNHSNGIRISMSGVHRFCVPSEVLDEACEYTVVAADMVNHSDEGYKNAGALVVLNKAQAKIIMNQENKTVLEGTVKF